MANVDVIIPCRNAAGLVGRAIASAQQPNVKQILCVDDHSTDQTRQAIAEAAKSSSVPVCILDGGAAGANAARNVGLAASHSEYCQFLDADDELLPGKIAGQLEHAQTGAAEVIVGSFHRRWPDGTNSIVSVRPDPWHALIASELGCTSSALFLRQALVNVEGWREGLESSQEYDLFFRLLQQRKTIGYTTHPLTVKHEVMTAISHTSPVDRVGQFVSLRAEIRAFLLEQDLLTNELSSLVDDTIHRALRRLNDDVQARIQALRLEHLPHDFAPSAPTRGARAYSKLYRLLGPRRAEAIRTTLKQESS